MTDKTCHDCAWWWKDGEQWLCKCRVPRWVLDAEVVASYPNRIKLRLFQKHSALADLCDTFEEKAHV